MTRLARRPLPKEGEVLAGKYRVERVLGAGGMGVVVAATHVTLAQRVALKLMLPEAASTPGAVERFLREARAVAQLRSDHVARVLDAGTLAEGEPFIAMELLEGSDLQRLLEARGRLPLADAIRYVRQACEGVGEAHARGIVHRDLKPANLFLTTDARGEPRVKVLDFGISKSVAAGEVALTTTAAVMGSPLYMSPEQMRGARDVDPRSDVWSLGVTLYELLAGQAPFVAESPMELGAKVLHEEPTPISRLREDVPVVVAEVIARCLSKDPRQRPATARELAAALDAATSSPGTSVRGSQVPAASAQDPSLVRLVPSTPARAQTPRSERRTSRRWTVAAIAALLSSVAVGALLLGASAGHGPGAPAASPVPDAPRLAATLAPAAPAPPAPPPEASTAPASSGHDPPVAVERAIGRAPPASTASPAPRRAAPPPAAAHPSPSAAPSSPPPHLPASPLDHM